MDSKGRFELACEELMYWAMEVVRAEVVYNVRMRVVKVQKEPSMDGVSLRFYLRHACTYHTCQSVHHRLQL